MHAVFVCAFSVAFYKYLMLRNMTGETQFFTLKTIIIPYKLPRLCLVFYTRQHAADRSSEITMGATILKGSV